MSVTDITVRDLLEAGCHFGHTRGRRHPNMAEYVYITRERVNIIDLEKTLAKLKDLLTAVENFVAEGKVLVMVGTKRQAQAVVKTIAVEADIPYVSERWLGGMLTNFTTVSKSIKRMNELDEYLSSKESEEEKTKRERLMLQRELDRLRLKVGGLKDIKKIPDGLFIVDPSYEKNAVKEARDTNLAVFALLDTNSNPMLTDEFVPANDDAAKSIMLVLTAVKEAIARGKERAVETARVAVVAKEEAAAKAEAEATK